MGQTHDSSTYIGQGLRLRLRLWLRLRLTALQSQLEIIFVACVCSLLLLLLLRLAEFVVCIVIQDVVDFKTDLSAHGISFKPPHA